MGLPEPFYRPFDFVLCVVFVLFLSFSVVDLHSCTPDSYLKVLLTVHEDPGGRSIIMVFAPDD